MFDEKGKKNDIDCTYRSFCGGITKKPRRGGVSFGPAATAIALAKVSGVLCFSGRERDLVSTILEINPSPV